MKPHTVRIMRLEKRMGPKKLQQKGCRVRQSPLFLRAIGGKGEAQRLPEVVALLGCPERVGCEGDDHHCGEKQGFQNHSTCAGKTAMM